MSKIKISGSPLLRRGDSTSTANVNARAAGAQLIHIEPRKVRIVSPTVTSFLPGGHDGGHQLAAVSIVEPVASQVARSLNPLAQAMPNRAMTSVTPTCAGEPAQHGGGVTAKRKKRQTPEAIDVTPLEMRRWLTIKETTARYPCFTEPSLRHLVFNAEAYRRHPKNGLRSNGFLDCIVRPAGQRKVLINAEKFEQWLKRSAAAGADGQLADGRNA